MHLAPTRPRTHPYLPVPMRWYAPASQVPRPEPDRATVGAAICLVTGLDTNAAVVILNTARGSTARLPPLIRRSVELELANPGHGLGVAEASLRRRVVRTAGLAYDCPAATGNAHTRRTPPLTAVRLGARRARACLFGGMRLGVRERSHARVRATTLPSADMGREIRQRPRRSLLQMTRGGVPRGSMEATIQFLETTMEWEAAVLEVSRDRQAAEPPQRAPKVRAHPVARVRSRPCVCGFVQTVCVRTNIGGCAWACAYIYAYYRCMWYACI